MDERQNSANSARKERESTKKNKERMLVALKSYMGVIAGACDKVGIDRNTHYSWLKADPKYAQAVDAIGERAIDLAESKLLQLVRKENPQAVFFLLETRGKRRGYIKKQEMEHSGSLARPVAIEIVVGDPKKKKRLLDAINSARGDGNTQD